MWNLQVRGLHHGARARHNVCRLDGANATWVSFLTADPLVMEGIPHQDKFEQSLRFRSEPRVFVWSPFLRLIQRETGHPILGQAHIDPSLWVGATQNPESKGG